ncbi:MAG: O-antigen ligase family protein [Gemmatimonadaceae bacterium]|nr:O-antigen ligase family protein [Gemmatimonadaceae bacterium]
MTTTTRPPSVPALLPGIGSNDAKAAPRRFARLERKATTRAIGAIVVVVVISVLIMLMTGSVVLAQMPAQVALVGYIVWTQPLRRTMTVVVFAQFFFFTPQYASGPLYQGVLRPGSLVVNGLLKNVTGINAMSFTGIELAFVCMFILLIIREVRGQRIDAEGRVPGARVLFVFLGLELLAALTLEAWGLVTGGSARVSIFQIRPFIVLPLQTIVLSYTLRDSRDFRRLALWATLAAMLKVALGVYFLNKDAWSLGLEASYMSSHVDSVLFVTVVFAWFAAWAHAPSWPRFLGMGGVVSWMLLGIVVNDRRLAWVSLVASLGVFYTTVNGMLRRRANLALIALAPFLALYLGIASKVSTGIFSPGHTLLGIANTSDGSSQWRILEMQNLVWNLDQHRFLGSGFGKQWVEIVTLPSVAQAFKEYRTVAHNSVLWLLQLSGIVGFVFMWMPIIVGIFLAARSYRFARTGSERTCAATVIAIVLCYVNQAWGDIGLIEPLNTMMLSLALALAGKLAIETGAWSPDARLLSR